MSEAPRGAVNGWWVDAMLAAPPWPAPESVIGEKRGN